MRRILVLENDKNGIEMISKCLIADGNTIQIAEDSAVALHRLKAWKPQLILLNKEILGTEWESFVSKIRSLTMDDYVCIILMSSKVELSDVTKKIEFSADDHLKKPFEELELICRVHTMLRFKEVQDALKRANHRIEELLSADELTGLMNMRAIFRRGEEEIARSKKFHRPISSLLINLDGFSTVNQSYGFIIGSQVLQSVAARIKQCLRPDDAMARVGADEFFVLLADTDLTSAEAMAEKIRGTIQSSPFKNEKANLKLTATFGVAGLNQDNTTQRMSDLLHITSEALKSAKANGINQIEVYSFT